MNPLPILEHTNNLTGRFLCYSVEKRGVIYHLIKHVVKQSKNKIDVEVFLVYSTLNFELLHEAVLVQGFVPMKSDNPTIVIEYL